MNIKYLNVLTFLMLWLLNGEFLAAQGDCENLPADCSVEAIDLGTGVNVAGGRDQAWQIIEEPNGNTLAFAPFLAVSPPGAWDQNAGGQWVAPTNVVAAVEDQSNVGDPDPYIYQRCFCTCAGSVLTYDLQIFADNFIDQVRLGGQVLYTRGTGVGNTTHFINGIHLQGSLNVGSGTHCLEIEVDNTDFVFLPTQTLGASSTGLKVIGGVSGGNLLQDGCCELITDTECCDEGEGTIFREDFTNGFVSANTDYFPYNGQQLNPGEYGFINSGQASTLSNNQWDVVDPTNCDPNTSFLAINGRTGGTGFAIAYETDLFDLEPGDIYDICVELKHLPQCLFDQVPQVRIAIFEYRAMGPGTPVFWSPVTSLQAGAANCDYQTLTATFTGPNTALIRDYALRIYVDERPQGDGNDFAVDNININQRLPTDPALALFYTDDLRAQVNEIHCTPVSPLPDNCSAFWEVWEAPSRDDPTTRLPGTYMWGNDNVNGWNTNSQTLFPAYGGSSPAGSFLEDHVYVIQRTVRCPCELTARARDIRDSGFSPLLPPEGEYLAKKINHPQTVHLFPNPATSTFNLLFGQPTNASEVAQLYAPSGRLVREILIEAGVKQLEVEVRELPAGMYYLQVQLDGEEFHQKLIKQ